MTAGLVKDPAGNQLAFTAGVCGDDDLGDVLAEQLCFDVAVLSRGLLYDGQFPLLWDHGKKGHVPFTETLVIFFRIRKCNEMPQRPCDDIPAAFDRAGKILMAVQNPGNIAGYRRFFG